MYISTETCMSLDFRATIAPTNLRVAWNVEETQPVFSLSNMDDFFRWSMSRLVANPVGTDLILLRTTNHYLPHKSYWSGFCQQS